MEARKARGTREVQRKAPGSDEELLLRIRAGEEGAMDELIERYKRQVRNQARALYLIGGDSDDLIQEGMLGLFKAIRDYQPGKGTPFHAFARLCIARQLYSAVQAAGRQKHAPLNSYVELSEGLDQAQTPQEPSPEELLIDKENLEKLKAELQRALSPLEREVLQAYLAGERYTETARRLGIDEKAVDNALQRIRRKVKKFLKN